MKTRRQTINFLGFLRGQLSGLQGIPTLCYELIQNADDVKDKDNKPGGASRISFDVCDDALWVENDGLFREVDFDRMEQISWGNKREEAETTGSFGIGFVSVYQITDSPELFSSGQHWRFRPQAEEDKRILIEFLETENTRFCLPWAFEVSQIRQELGIPPVKPEQLDNITAQMIQSIESAALFLKQVRVLEVKRNGQLFRRIEVLKDGNELLLEDGEQLIQWSILQGSFEDAATEMRQRYGALIEEKRKSEVQLAIPDRSLKNGLLYAFLPSETHTGLPFHINADFYPSSDRKRILFDQDYKSEWNRLAIECAAYTLSANVDELLRIYSPAVFWEFAERVKKTSETFNIRAPFEMFWDLLKPEISQNKTVLTTAGRFVCPPESNYLDHDFETAAATIFEDLDIHTVHSDLRKFRNVLIDTGVQLLKVSKVAQAFHDKGYTKRFELSDMPASLQTENDWNVLWKALQNLWERASLLERNHAGNLLRSSAIAFGSDKAVWPPEDLFSADEKTVELYSKISNVIWFIEVGEVNCIPGSLIPDFTLDDGINALQDSKDRLEGLWKENKFSPGELYEWLENHPETNRLSFHQRNRLRELAVWPSADGRLKPLEGLFLPGGFEDPLNLAQFVDVKALGGGRDFLLQSLHVSQLDFKTYVRDWIPSVIKTQVLQTEKKIHLLEVMSLNIGQMRGDHKLQKSLGELDFVWCGEETFCAASIAYFNTTVIHEVLGSKVKTAKVPKKQEEAVQDLYKWLGVAKKPRHTDVIARVNELITSPPTNASVQSISLIYGYLANQWDRWEEQDKGEFQLLKTIFWLPGTVQKDRWFSPSEVYTVFQDYLFESQGNFLRIDRKVQEESKEFNRFLEITSTPKTDQVVRHLLFCAKNNKPVTNVIYNHLSRDVNDPSITMLVGKQCLFLKDEAGEEKYYLPEHVFWENHPFGRFRFRLGPEFGPYKELFEKLGVKEKPSYIDAMGVLKEVSESKYAKSSMKIIEEPSLEPVILAAWRLISEALEAEEVDVQEVKRELGKLKTIPNSQYLLYPPEWLFVEDRPGWGSVFQLLKNNLIEKPQGAWPAMEAAGVRRLSKAIKTELHQCDNPREDLELQSRFLGRKDLVKRVIEAHGEKSVRSFNIDRLDRVSFSLADEIVIIRSFRGFGHSEKRQSTVDSVFLDETLYFSLTDGTYPWISIARELAYAIHDSDELSSLGMELKEILSPETAEQASKNLDEFGYPPVKRTSEIQPEPATIKQLGGFDPVSSVSAETAEIEPQSDPSILKPSQELGDKSRPDKKLSKTKQKPKRKTSRLISYVYPEDMTSDKTASTSTTNRRKEIGQLGVDIVIAFERSQGRDAVDMETIQVNHEGFDVKSIDQTNPGDIRYIEVKATSGTWDSQNPAQLHKSQFEFAQEYGERCWLYIVEKAESDKPKIYCIQNPANRIDAFMFDHGWEPLAEVFDGTSPFGMAEVEVVEGPG